MDTTEATAAAREASNSRVVEWGARLGYVTVGLIHLLIAWIALKVAWGFGGGSKKADTSGALQTLSSTGTGVVLLWICVVGFLLLAVWQLLEAALRHSETSRPAQGGGQGRHLPVLRVVDVQGRPGRAAPPPRSRPRTSPRA